ncbi:hypothetical protein BV898_00936 [Hypsibius exemplaris]|uniref:Polycomb protein VEFS-Box domain-containing protein n=1 Tax=Hypsibius exemplaris TaxID=2072580 RepID=A0A1W0XD67_HYPEX|nr:hypothetical protein BV898_00936 [Hypsibius exemplaris]
MAKHAIWQGPHPLIPTDSQRKPVILSQAQHHSIIPTVLPERNLEEILVKYPLVATQATIVQARGDAISTGRILLRRCFVYNLAHRRYRTGHCDCTRAELQTGQVAFLESIVFKIWLQKLSHISTASRADTIRNFACDDGDKALNEQRTHWIKRLMKHVDTFKKLPSAPVAFFVRRIQLKDKPGRLQSGNDDGGISLKCALVAANQVASKDYDYQIVQAGPKLAGTLDENGGVTFNEQGFSLSHWGRGARLVLRLDGLEEVLPNNVVFFDLLPKPNEHSSIGFTLTGKTRKIRVEARLQWQAPVPKEAHLKFWYVFIYASGSVMQVREMAIIRRPEWLTGTTCLFCRMACDSIVNLLRHIEGCHPGVGFEYDPAMGRLYFWFSPEKTLIRCFAVPGLIDNDILEVKFHRRQHLTTSIKHGFRMDSRGELIHSIGILDWMSSRYHPNRERDPLPVFNLKHVTAVYGVPISLAGQMLVQMHGIRTCRPDLKNLCDLDSDDDDESQQIHRANCISEISDASDTEKAFMILWNRFLRTAGYIPYHRMFATLQQFVRAHGTDIELMDCYSVFVAHVVVFQRDGYILKEELRNIMKYYRQIVRL